MRQNWFKVALLIMSLFLPLACVFTELFQSVPTPTTNHAPLAEDIPQPVIYRGTTDQEGKAIVVDSQGSEQAIVQVEDEDSRLPVPGIEVYFMQRGSSYLVVAIDPEGGYLTSWSQGSLEELKSSRSSLITLASFFPSRPAYAQPLPLIMLLVKGVSTVSSLKDLGALLQNPPELAYWGWLYEDKCWTGEQLANFVGAAGLILPGIDEVAGVLLGEMDEIMWAIFASSQHVIEEDAKGHLLGLDRPVRIRSYHLGIPALGMVPVGWCEPEATPTATARALPVPTSVPIGGGGKIAFTYEGSLWIMNADDGERTRITENLEAWSRPSWSPDGEQIAFTAKGSIYVANVDRSGVIRLEGRPGCQAADPSWSPDGKRIAYYFQCGSTSSGPSGVAIMNADGSDSADLVEFASFPAWSPDGTKIAVEGPISWKGDVGLYILDTSGNVLSRVADMGMYPDWSPDGSKIVHDFEAFIAIVDLTRGSELRLPVEGLGPSWSPDGQRIAFSSFTNGRTIFTMNPDGSDVRELGPGNEPAWWP